MRPSPGSRPAESRLKRIGRQLIDFSRSEHSEFQEFLLRRVRQHIAGILKRVNNYVTRMPANRNTRGRNCAIGWRLKAMLFNNAEICLEGRLSEWQAPHVEYNSADDCPFRKSRSVVVGHCKRSKGIARKGERGCLSRCSRQDR